MNDNILQYDPLRWPPDLQLAKVHMSCVCPGKDNVQGIQCPCCGRYEKIKTKNWYSRDIFRDFKSYGGGIPCYFSLLKYCAGALFILTMIVVVFHIYILETTCPIVLSTLQSCTKIPDQKLKYYQCQQFLKIFKVCDTKIILQTLRCNKDYVKLYMLFYLEMFSFVYLIAATLGMKLWLQRTNTKQIVKEEKLYSLYSLMIKNVPKFYNIDDLRKELQEQVPGAEICQLFFVYEIAELENSYKKLFDLHFVIQYVKESVASDRGQTLQHLQQLTKQYRDLYQKTEELKKNLVLNNGRAIAVFNNIEQRNKLYKALKINQCSKLVFHTSKLLGKNTRNLHLFADKLPEPPQILWKYIGQSSVTKTWVRIKTTLIGFGFMIIAFLILYFPIIKIDQQSILKHSGLTSALNFLVSIILQILAIVYRQIIMRIIPARHPSSRQAQSYFIVITTVVFHFFFYIIAPATYFILSYDIPPNIKLKQLFAAVLMFLIMTILVAFLDLRYRIFNSRRKKIITSWTQWGKYCQVRLHEQIRWPSFPIQFKLMVIFNIWSFNAFYVFQIPYLMFLFVIVILIIYWVDKKNIYKHYKMQVYQSIDLQLSVQRDYLFMFLVCVCCGYAVSAEQYWQYIFIGIMFILALFVNFLISFRNKKQKKKQDKINKTMSLCQVIKAQSTNPKQSMLHQIIETQYKQNMLLMGMENVSTVSLGSIATQYGYKQLYENYLVQFKNRHVNKLLQQTNNYFKSPQFNIEHDITEIRRLTAMTHLNVNGNENESNNVKNMKKNDSDRFRQSAMISSNLSRVNNNKSKSNLDSASINNSQSKYSNNNSNKLQNQREQRQEQQRSNRTNSKMIKDQLQKIQKVEKAILTANQIDMGKFEEQLNRERQEKSEGDNQNDKLQQHQLNQRGNGQGTAMTVQKRKQSFNSNTNSFGPHKNNNNNNK